MKLLKYRDIEIALPCVRPKTRGFFKLVATKLDGTQRDLTGWFPNLVTDGGLNQMGIAAFRNLCVVGTGSTAPTFVDAQLQTTVARTTTGAPSIPGATAQTTPTYYGTTYTGFRFSVGAAAGNLTEVGIGWHTGNGLLDYVVWSRALILDEFDAPTSVTVLSDEVLDVYYSMRLYPPTVDEVYSINISSEPYDCVTRAAQVTNAILWSMNSGRVLFQTFKTGSTGPGVFNGDIGLITGFPSGVTAYNAVIANNAYSNNSLTQDGVLSWGLDQGNVTGGIKSVYYQTGVGAYQTSFTPPIPKDATKVLSVNFRVGWDRH